MAVRSAGPTRMLALLAAAALAACGGDAESADDEASLRVIPPAEESVTDVAEAPEVVEETAAPTEPATDPAAGAEPELEPAARPEPAPRTRERSEAVRERPAPMPAAPPVVERDDVVEEPAPRPAAEPEPRAVPAGRTLDLTLVTRLTTEEAREGDAFWATVTEDVLGADGEVLVPLGSRVRGRVVESRESASADEPAVLGLALETITVNGAERPVRASVVEVDVAAQSRDSDGKTAVKVGIGAAAGAVLGKILGKDDKDALRGAAVGAIAGTAVAVATKDGHATIEEGARIVVRLDEPFVVEGRDRP